jgi:hypothetical protein
MTLAEGLLLRKHLDAKVKQLTPIKIAGDNGLFDLKVERKKVSEDYDEATVRVPKISLAEITRTYDHYACELRKLDGAIQKANWQYTIDYSETKLEN